MKYVFPSSVIDFGTKNSYGIDFKTSDLITLNSRSFGVFKQSKLYNVLGPTRIDEQMESLRSIKLRMNNRFEYYSTQNMQNLVNEALLKTLLEEEMMNQRKLRKFDPQSSNQLLYVKDYDYLFLPSGPTMSKLVLYTLHHGKISYPNELALEHEFKTPIKQITRFGNKIAVRTIDGIHTIDLDSIFDFKTDGLIIEDTSHFSSNPMICADSTIILNKGELLAWDFERQSHYNRLGPIDNWNYIDNRWNTRKCEYAAHPRTIYLLESTQISFLDYRTDLSQTQFNLCYSEPTDYFTNIARSKFNPLQFSYSSATKTAIMDLRVPNHPLLTWNFNDKNEHQFFVQYLDEPINNSPTFCSYGRHNGEVLLYSYQQQNDCPPLSANILKIPSFHSHEYISNPKIEMIPQMTALETITFQTFLKEREQIPAYPTLEGVAFIHHENNSEFTVLQLNALGAVFCQSYSSAIEGDCYDDIEGLKEIEKCVGDLYIELNSTAVDSESKSEGNFKILNFQSIFKSTIN